jgi:hypothetical protein
MYIIDIIIMSYSLKPDLHIICQRGCIINKYYLPKHLRIKKPEMLNRENVEEAEAVRYKPRN